ncbi:hypothetical protein NONO_c73600 [Nocardia nova SH22a]|uniref:Uncharacterized protein n=1 Tax=Nocardia nova SH22a TaxID=1415166 RepID=W5TY14_9NOCA|nr:hypothetical protein [Nocardia nova]AHH22116.1 hypothetical protein NONO_c73600 [Nocardia nova SH22a]
MMKTFEFISAKNGFHESVAIQPNREALWSAAFGVDSLDGLFDMTPAKEALPRIDAAIRKFNEDPEMLRELLAPDDLVGLRGSRGALVRIRNRMAKLDGTISGAVDESGTSASS